ncbi:ribbon-helix-helix domain-containing protein [Methylobacterium sp. ID0610]|uniref:ribbon-helix-helix domain-containing protein n=1 Tax=Methylobacterium carpenticola TaxID=3344827 RepID=UPI0036CA6C15
MSEGAAGLRKRSVMIAGHRTSVSLEDAFWEALQRLAGARGLSVQALIGRIDAGRSGQNLSSAIRVYVLREIGAAPQGPSREGA